MTDPFRVFVIGASAGGVETLIRLCQELPENLPAAVFVVLHTSPNGPGMLPAILNRHAPLPAEFAQNGDQIMPGKIYIAPPDQHVKIQTGQVELWHGPSVNLLRPAADVTFHSAAQAYGPLAVGVVLSGTRNDGTAGLLSIKEHGGTTIVQDPDEAIFSGMPRSAIDGLVADYVLTIEEIAKKISEIANLPIDPALVTGDERSDPPGDDQKAGKKNMEHSKRALQEDRKEFENEKLSESTRTVLTCPECGGVLVETHNGNMTRYECQIGHGFSESSFIAGHSGMVEHALWSAVRALDERVLLLERMASRAIAQNRNIMAERFRLSAEEARKDAEVIRRIVSNGKVTSSQEILPENGQELQ